MSDELMASAYQLLEEGAEEIERLRSALHEVCDAYLREDKDHASMRMHQIAHAALRKGNDE